MGRQTNNTILTLIVTNTGTTIIVLIILMTTTIYKKLCLRLSFAGTAPSAGFFASSKPLDSTVEKHTGG